MTGILIGRMWSDASILRNHGVAVVTFALLQQNNNHIIVKTLTWPSPPLRHLRTVPWVYYSIRARFRFHCHLSSHRTRWGLHHRVRKSRKNACTRLDHREWPGIHSEHRVISSIVHTDNAARSQPWACSGTGWRKSFVVDSQMPIYTGQSIQYVL